MEGKDIQVSIIGGGLVGSLCSCVLAKHGIRVKLYEYRDDVRKTGIVDDGRRMNLVLSERGISALRLAGLEDINKYTTPITGRMMHKCDGTRVPFPMDNKGRCTYSIVRKDLNEVLLTMTEKNPNVEIFFKHKFKSFDFKNRKFYLQGPDGEIKEKSSDLLIGCDGAYSAVRRQMAKTPRFDCSQSYFDNGYIEITMPPTATGEFAMEGDYLHFWPRKNVMLAALPNKDRSYTVSLFMPFEIFEQLSTREKLLQFFTENFPDAIPLIGKEKLVTDFFRITPSAMITIKCNPYHIEDKVMILGDAAHAMLPFNGQGMNAGFEDCQILSELLSLHNYDLRKVLPAFTNRRHKDAQIVSDLAKATFTIMKRHTSKKFLLRSKIDNLLNSIFPSWIVLSTEVAFSRNSYAECFARKQKQDKILYLALWSTLIVVFAFMVSVWARL